VARGWPAAARAAGPDPWPGGTRPWRCAASPARTASTRGARKEARTSCRSARAIATPAVFIRPHHVRHIARAKLHTWVNLSQGWPRKRADLGGEETAAAPRPVASACDPAPARRSSRTCHPAPSIHPRYAFSRHPPPPTATATARSGNHNSRQGPVHHKTKHTAAFGHSMDARPPAFVRQSPPRSLDSCAQEGSSVRQAVAAGGRAVTHMS
jgi:hypothetical protein